MPELMKDIFQRSAGMKFSSILTLLTSSEPP